MPSQLNLTVYEANDSQIVVTIAPEAGGTLAGLTGLRFVMKPSTCEDDADDDAVVLTVGSGIVIDSQTDALITATVTLPAAALTETYERAYRVDALFGAAVRTALYGSLTVVDL